MRTGLATPDDLSLDLPKEKRVQIEKGEQPFVLSARLSPRDDPPIVERPMALIWRQHRPPSPLAILERRRFTLNFVEDADALIFKMDGSQFYIVDIGDAEAKPTRRSFEARTFDGDDSDVYPASMPFLYPPIAAVKYGTRWRAAWLTESGVLSLETESGEGGAAFSSPERPLMAGDTGGARLHFALRGDFLILVQQKQWGAAINVRIWDLRDTRRRWINEAGESDLFDVACKILRSDGISGGLSDVDAKQFGVPDAYQHPCSTGDGR